MLFQRTKLQKLTAIHNNNGEPHDIEFVVSKNKVTKIDSYSQPVEIFNDPKQVVSKNKVTKIDSYSQPYGVTQFEFFSCFKEQSYKN